MQKQRKQSRETDNRTAKQQKFFKQTGDIYDYLPFNPSISSVLPPPPSQEELRQLWDYNRQHRFTTQRSPLSRPDRNHNLRQVPILRQVPNHRPYLNHNHRQALNLRPDLNGLPRQAPYPAPLPRQPQPLPRPVLNFPLPQEWIWVRGQSSYQCHRFRRIQNLEEDSTRTTDRCHLCRRNWALHPPLTTRTIGTSTTEDAASQQEDIWVEIRRDRDDLFRRRAEEEDDPSYLP